jgi:hypothetical protein
MVKENSQILKKYNQNSDKNINIYSRNALCFNESGKFNESSELTDNNNKNLNFDSNNNVSANYFTKKNNNFHIMQDSIIREFDNSLYLGSLINNDTNNYNCFDINKFEIPNADQKESIFSEKDYSIVSSNFNKKPNLINTEQSKEAEEEEEEEQVELMLANKPAEAEQNKSLIQQIERFEEPKKPQESFFEETFFEETKEKYSLFNPSENDDTDLALDRASCFKNDKHSLMNLFGKCLIQNWSDISKRKLDKIKQGIKEDKFLQNAFFEEEPLVDFPNKASSRDFIKRLDSYKENIMHIYDDCSGKEFFEMNDLLKVQEVPACECKNVEGKNVLVEPKYNWGNNKKYLEEKKTLLEKLSKRQTKTTFNKISFLNDCEVLKQKYFVCDENLRLNSYKAPIFGFTEELDKIWDDFSKEENNLDEVNEKINFDKNGLFNNKQINDNHLEKRNDEKIYLWRESLCDGNSFYRMFIFAYFESLILTKNFDLLAKIFFHIYKVYQNLYLINESKSLDNEKFIFNKINLKIILMTFNLIINFMRINDYASAYKIMINAFNSEDGSFDKVKFSAKNK